MNRRALLSTNTLFSRVTGRIDRVRFAFVNSILVHRIEAQNLTRIRFVDLVDELLGLVFGPELELLDAPKGSREHELRAQLLIVHRKLCDLCENKPKDMLRHHRALQVLTTVLTACTLWIWMSNFIETRILNPCNKFFLEFSRKKSRNIIQNHDNALAALTIFYKIFSTFTMNVRNIPHSIVNPT